MKITVVGTRGIPDVQGGVETHCQELYPRLVKLGCEVTLLTRTPYVSKQNRKSSFKDVNLVHVYAPRKKFLEAITHTFIGILYCKLHPTNILHVHAIGPALLVPFARLLGIRTVITHHGPDYDRQKWGKAAKFTLRLGESMGVRFANKIITISQVIADLIRNKYGHRDVSIIHNGVTRVTPAKETDYLESLGLTKNRYTIAVGRFVEEKGFHDLIKVFSEQKHIDTTLVLIGDADHESTYSKYLKKNASSKNNIILTGFIKGEKLHQLFSHARLFVLPSYHEGLPIVLLEAMSYNLPLLVSDIPANLEVNLSKNCYFRTGNVEDLSKKLFLKLAETEDVDFSVYLREKYDWDSIAKTTLALYCELLNKGNS